MNTALQIIHVFLLLSCPCMPGQGKVTKINATLPGPGQCYKMCIKINVPNIVNSPPTAYAAKKEINIFTSPPTQITSTEHRVKNLNFMFVCVCQTHSMDI